MEPPIKSRIFQKNVDKYAQVAPQIALLLPYVDYSQVEHQSIDGPQEAEEWFSTLDLKDKDVLFIYGVGSGQYYQAAKDWLKQNKKRKLVFLEDDTRYICRLFETELGSQILKDKQAHLFYFKDMDDLITFDKISWDFYGKAFKISALNQYSLSKSEIYSQLKHRLPYDANRKKNIVDEYLEHGEAFLRNFYSNMLQLPYSYLGNNFFGKFSGIPAIICGAGPSLQKQIPLLKNLSNKALIFSGSASLNALNYGGVQAHFGAGIDPNDEQYKRLSDTTPCKIPFFYRNRMNNRAFQTVQGPRLYITGAGGYKIADWFEEKLQIEGKRIEEGHNVINFCLEIAHEMGCNPIIFVGMDLAYTGMQAYAPGVVGDAKIDLSMMNENWLTKEDINGEQVYTEWKWIAESKWISQFAENHPELTIVNATEGGIGFEKVANRAFEKVINEHLTKSFDLSTKINETLQNSVMKGVTKEKIIGLMQKLKESLSRCMEYFDILKKGEKTSQAVLAEIEILDEVAYQYILEFFNTVYLHVNPRNSNKKRYQFLKDTALANIHWIDLALS